VSAHRKVGVSVDRRFGPVSDTPRILHATVRGRWPWRSSAVATLIPDQTVCPPLRLPERPSQATRSVTERCPPTAHYGYEAQRQGRRYGRTVRGTAGARCIRRECRAAGRRLVGVGPYQHTGAIARENRHPSLVQVVEAAVVEPKSPTEYGLRALPRRVGNTASSSPPPRSASHASSTATVWRVSGRAPLLATLPVAADVGAGAEHDVAAAQRGHLRDPHPGLEHGGEQGVIASADPGAAIGSLQQGFRLEGRQVGDHLPAGPREER
jgi:hypothetical protein